MTKHLDTNSVGVEIEAERRDKFRGKTSGLGEYWRLEEDGSLRNMGLELVFTRPMRGAEAVEALALSEKALRDCSFSKRCGLHVHIDCRDLTSTQIKAFVMLYTLFEPVLFPLCGEGRETSNFCVPVGANRGLLRRLARRGALTGAVSHRADDTGRYSALNLQALNKYGSLEFRSMEGTCSSSRILQWIEILLCLKEKGKTRPKLKELLDRASEDAPVIMFEEIFQDNCEAIFQAAGAEFHERLIEGARNLQYVLHCRAETAHKDLLSKCSFDRSDMTPVEPARPGRAAEELLEGARMFTAQYGADVAAPRATEQEERIEAYRRQVMERRYQVPNPFVQVWDDVEEEDREPREQEE